jgi:formamidopyrimidine-DNA glycosylase
MPELPEVETIRRQLQIFLVGHKIIKVEVNFRKTLKDGEEYLKEGKIVAVKRIGKVLIINLDNSYSALIHLKMTGQLLYKGPNLKTKNSLSEKIIGGVPGKHTHVIFYLDKGGILYFNDYRKFGWVKVMETKKIKENELVGKMGPEPLKDFKLDYFKSILSKSNKPIKLTLLDQSKIAGLGNIYVNDILWLSKIDPRRKTSSLSQQEQINLFKNIGVVLKVAISKKGSSENAYVTPDGGEGSYHEHFLAYGRKGEACRNKCGARIEKIKLGGRGTYYCPKCQK